MATPNSTRIRLIFGLKTRQLRQELKLSLAVVAERAGLSVSYLNEIEKGKKYPKTEKIFALATALQTDYDTLVSIRLNKHLEPIAELFNTNIFQELPFEAFGIEPADLLEILADKPTKFSAFIRTIIEISRSYGLKFEQFYFSALRSFQEMNDNFFEDIEATASDFLIKFPAPTGEHLSHLLTEKYGYCFEVFSGETHQELSGIRSFFRVKDNTLFLNANLREEQRTFTLAREVGYAQLGISDRPLISSVLEAESFEQVLNNFRASYFAGAVLLPRQQFVEALRVAFSKAWQPDILLALMERFKVTPEVFFQRISNLLAPDFGLTNFFFLRFDNTRGDSRYYLSRRMDTSRGHHLHTFNEHHCRRWLSIKTLQHLAEKPDAKGHCAAQVSEYVGSTKQYLVLSMAKASPPKNQVNSSVSLGIELTEAARKIFQFVDTLPRVQVGETCERCNIADCKERAAAPVFKEKHDRLSEIRTAIEQLSTP